MKKIYIKYSLILLLVPIFLITSCTNEFDIKPKGTLSGDMFLGNPDYIDSYVIAAYSLMPSLGVWGSYNPWVHGSVRSDDAYKGGGGLQDVTSWLYLETFAPVTPSLENNDGLFYDGYRIVSRCNMAVEAINMVTEEQFPLKNVRMGESRFLRGNIYFHMKLIWRHIPWIDENNMSMEDVRNTPNRQENDNDMIVWEKILADFEYAVENLPESQGEDIGRVNKNAARAMAAKTLLFMAYEQDKSHQVVNINKQRLEKALVYINEITAQEGTTVDLCSDFANNFLPEYDNATKESIWETQYSHNDQTDTGGRFNWGDELTAPYWEPYFPCCDFHKISFNLVNAFRTDANGLPLFDTFNNAELKNNYKNYFDNNTFDPRLNHTVAIPGLPWKYDPDLLYDSTGSRSPADYGYMHSMKEQVHPDCDCLRIAGWVQNSMNKRNIRYAEILLWKAEILIQLDRHREALPLINKLRQRSADSTVRLRKKNGSPYLNYKIGLYPNDATWTKEYAWKALMFENRVETGGEGRRFFDLLRWGLLSTTMNDYFAKERTRYSWMNSAYFMAGRDEYRPIPENQIGWMAGKYTQNPNYN
jgi:hypothetical protein